MILFTFEMDPARAYWPGRRAQKSAGWADEANGKMRTAQKRRNPGLGCWT